MAPPTTRDGRQNNGALLLLFTVLAAIGLYTMRITTTINGIPVDFLESIQAGTLINGSPIKRDYTGIQLLDEGLSFLVAAFVYGPAGWNEPYYWQQIHFLVQIAPIIVVMTVEACRERNQGSWLKYTTIWALIYQNVGGAIIITIWWILFHRMSNPKSYYQSGREVPLSYARMILPGIVLFYVIPTFAIWLPTDKSLVTLQSILAFWQFTPLLVNIPLWLVSLTGSAATTPKTTKADVFHLKILYAFSFFLSVAVHWYTIYGISVSPNPDVNFASVFIPSIYTWDRDIAWGLLWIFQWDWVIVALMYFIAAWVAVCDVQRVKKGEASLENVFESFLVIMTITVGGGPGAGLSAAWFWREGNLAAIEGASVAKKGQ